MMNVPRLKKSFFNRCLDQLPEFGAGRDWYDRLFGDLLAAGLTNGTLHAVQTGASLWQPATSAMGKRFLAFVSDSAR